MKNYNIIRQEKNNFCICAVLQAIFYKYHIKISQEEIAENLTPAEKGFKIHDNSFKNFVNAKRFYFEFYWHNETPFNEPDSLLEEMIKNEGFIGINAHTYLLNNFNYPNVKLIDPKNCSIKEYTLSGMYKEMQNDNEGFFGLIKKLV